MSEPNNLNASDDWLEEAIIFSAKHVGSWDESLSERLKNGNMENVYVNIKSLKFAVNQHVQGEVRRGKEEEMELLLNANDKFFKTLKHPNPNQVKTYAGINLLARGRLAELKAQAGKSQ